MTENGRTDNGFKGVRLCVQHKLLYLYFGTLISFSICIKLSQEPPHPPLLHPGQEMVNDVPLSSGNLLTHSSLSVTIGQRLLGVVG